MQREANAALAAIWNTPQTGDVSALRVPVDHLQELEARGFVQGWKSESGQFFLVTPQGKEWGGLR